MGLGDEIMALGRAEREYERTGRPVTICGQTEAPRDHPAWHGNPAWLPRGGKKIIDGGGARPYIKHWHGRQAVFNMEYTPRAGRVFLSDTVRAACALEPPYAVVAPFLKDGASPNKSWGQKRWEAAIANFPVPVYQLCPDEKMPLIAGAIRYITPTWQDAMAAIERAALVMCNEGGSHHMAASAGVPAVVIFGAFTPPLVTGYEIHHNIAMETDEGYCGRYWPCAHCKKAMATITPEMVREKAFLILESYDAD